MYVLRKCALPHGCSLLALVNSRPGLLAKSRAHLIDCIVVDARTVLCKSLELLCVVDGLLRIYFLLQFNDWRRLAYRTQGRLDVFIDLSFGRTMAVEHSPSFVYSQSRGNQDISYIVPNRLKLCRSNYICICIYSRDFQQ